MPEITDEKPSEVEFCPSHDDLFLAFMDLLPRGPAWQNSDYNSIERDSLIKQFMSGLALSWKNLEDWMCASLDEWFCFSSTVNKDLWGLDYGVPDECDLYNVDVCAKAKAQHPTSAEAMITLLLENGYAAESRWLTGHDLEFPGVWSTFVVNIDPLNSPAYLTTTVLPFPLGEGYQLGAPTTEQLLCLLERYAPAHTAVIVNISGEWEPADLGSKILAWYHAEDKALGNVSSWTPKAPSSATTLVLVPIGTGIPQCVDYGGKKFVDFNGAHALRFGGTTGLPTGAAAASASMVVLSRLDAGSLDTVPRSILVYGGTGADLRALGKGSSANSVVVRSGTAFISDTSHTDISGLNTIAGRFIAADKIYGRYLGAPTEPPDDDYPATTIGTSGITIGATNDGLIFLTGGVRDAFILNSTATISDIMKLEAWLAWDVGEQDLLLPPDHPYRNMRP